MTGRWVAPIGCSAVGPIDLPQRAGKRWVAPFREFGLPRGWHLLTAPFDEQATGWVAPNLVRNWVGGTYGDGPVREICGSS